MSNEDKYIKFAEAAKICQCRFQQIYQRAVVRDKMKYIDEGKFKTVRLVDVEQYRDERIARGNIK